MQTQISQRDILRRAAPVLVLKNVHVPFWEDFSASGVNPTYSYAEKLNEEYCYFKRNLADELAI